MRIFMVAAGLVTLCMAVGSLGKKRMTEGFCIAWGILAAILICAGIVLRPDGWSMYISWGGLLLALLGLSILLASAFFLSVRVSVLSRQVRELAVQVSLLNRENEEIRQALGESTEKGGAAGREEENSARHQYAGPGRGGNCPDGAAGPAGSR